MQAILGLVIFFVFIIIFIWDKFPMATTAIMSCVIMVIVGVCDFKTAFGQFASNTVILTMGVMVIGASISETGLADLLGKWIIRISSGSEMKLLIGTYLVAALMSAFLTNSAVLAIFIPIIIGVSKTNHKINARNLILPIAYGCVIGGASTLVGSTQQMTSQGLLEEAGVRTFETFDFTIVGSILVLLGLIYCLTIGRKRGEKIWGDREDNSDGFQRKSEKKVYRKDKLFIMVLIFGGTVVSYITEWLPLAITSTLAALLCILTGCISQEKAAYAINWNIVGRLGGCLGLAKALEASGGTQLLSNSFSNLVGEKISPFFLFCLLVLCVQIFSEFMTNSTAIIIVLPIVIGIAPRLHLNLFSFALGITLASGITLSCPLANSTLGMSMTAGYRFGDYFRYSIVYDIIAYVTIIVMIPFIYGLTV